MGSTDVVILFDRIASCGWLANTHQPELAVTYCQDIVGLRAPVDPFCICTGICQFSAVLGF